MTLPVEPVYTLEKRNKKTIQIILTYSVYLFHIHMILLQGTQTKMSICLYCMTSEKAHLKCVPCCDCCLRIGPLY